LPKVRLLKKHQQRKRKKNNPLIYTFVGLGNPGIEYSRSRHNIGFQVIDFLADKLNISLKKKLFANYMFGKGRYEEKEVFLIKPLTYMNRSGTVIHKVLRFTKTVMRNFVVICDHLDLPPGVCRFKKMGSSGGQKGLQSIIDFLQNDDFPRIFIGIGRPRKGESIPEYVLRPVTEEESAQFSSAVKTAGESLLLLMKTGPEKVMNELNRKK